jgi:hypothetical protein
MRIAVSPARCPTTATLFIGFVIEVTAKPILISREWLPMLARSRHIEPNLASTVFSYRDAGQCRTESRISGVHYRHSWVSRSSVNWFSV